jgi:hypothetical protein
LHSLDQFCPRTDSRDRLSLDPPTNTVSQRWRRFVFYER